MPKRIYITEERYAAFNSLYEAAKEILKNTLFVTSADCRMDGNSPGAGNRLRDAVDLIENIHEAEKTRGGSYAPEGVVTQTHGWWCEKESTVVDEVIHRRSVPPRCKCGGAVRWIPITTVAPIIADAVSPELEALRKIADLVEDKRDIHPEDPPRIAGLATDQSEKIADTVRPYRVPEMSPEDRLLAAARQVVTIFDEHRTISLNPLRVAIAAMEKK